MISNADARSENQNAYIKGRAAKTEIGAPSMFRGRHVPLGLSGEARSIPERLTGEKRKRNVSTCA